MKFGNHIAILIAAVFSVINAFAQVKQPPLTDEQRILQISEGDVNYQQGKFSLQEYLYVLVDSTGTLTFPEITSELYAAKFMPYSELSWQEG